MVLWSSDTPVDDGVLSSEGKVAQHPKHKYLERDFAVNRIFESFKETKILFTMLH